MLLFQTTLVISTYIHTGQQNEPFVSRSRTYQVASLLVDFIGKTERTQKTFTNSSISIACYVSDKMSLIQLQRLVNVCTSTTLNDKMKWKYEISDTPFSALGVVWFNRLSVSILVEAHRTQAVFSVESKVPKMTRWLSASLLCLLALRWSSFSEASHFRYGHIAWAPAADPYNNNTVG